MLLARSTWSYPKSPHLSFKPHFLFWGTNHRKMLFRRPQGHLRLFPGGMGGIPPTRQYRLPRSSRPTGRFSPRAGPLQSANRQFAPSWSPFVVVWFTPKSKDSGEIERIARVWLNVLSKSRSDKHPPWGVCPKGGGASSRSSPLLFLFFIVYS